MTIYLAGPWARRDEVRAVRDQLVAAGFSVGARWLDVPDMPQNAQTDEQAANLREEAHRDFEDIDAADIMVVMNLEKSEGKAVEQGYALANDMPIVVIGERLNVFQYLPQVVRVESAEDAIDFLTGFHLGLESFQRAA